MASEISGLLIALKDWQQAVKKLHRQGQPLAERQQAVEAARTVVLQHLQSEVVMAEIDELIQQAIAPDSPTPEAVRAALVQHTEPLIAVELRSLQPLPTSRKDLEKLISTFLQTPDAEKPVADSQQLTEMFVRLSLVIPQSFIASTPLPRKRKKRRRRDLTLGALHTTLGVGLLAGNTQLEFEAADYSYILGGNALMTAMQKFVGQVTD